MAGEAMQAGSWPCIWAAVLWMTTMLVRHFGERSIRTAGSSAARTVHFGLQVPLPSDLYLLVVFTVSELAVTSPTFLTTSGVCLKGKLQLSFA